MNETPAFSISDAWPIIEADDMVRCDDCGHRGKPEMRSIIEPHGEVILEPRCEACLSLWVSLWPRE